MFEQIMNRFIKMKLLNDDDEHSVCVYILMYLESYRMTLNGAVVPRCIAHWPKAICPFAWGIHMILSCKYQTFFCCFFFFLSFVYFFFCLAFNNFVGREIETLRWNVCWACKHIFYSYDANGFVCIGLQCVFAANDIAYRAESSWSYRSTIFK